MKTEKIDVWEVTPSMSSDYDFWVSKVSEDPDARKAMEYAKDVLECLWDDAALDDLNISVSIKRKQINEDDLTDDL